MVFYYTIRGGACQNPYSHIHLESEDITCYMGRDKHENEFLRQYGWPGDVWFHVEGLSSAHVYFRVKNIEKVPLEGLPLDSLPKDSIYDMQQIVKNNSISGCKLSRCKIVWTPHSNLKKTFDMDTGSVTYHNTKLCRYGRCEKDRTRVKELEKTKVESHNVNFYEEMKANERRIIERKKKLRKHQQGHFPNQTNTELYDPVLADLQSEKTKARVAAGNQGDSQSGLEKGLMALEGLSLDTTSTASSQIAMDSNGRSPSEIASSEVPTQPKWMIESDARQQESSKTIQFLRARGYPVNEAVAILDVSTSPTDALRRLWKSSDRSKVAHEPTPSDSIIERRHEEIEVLRAIFGEEDEGVHFAGTFDDDDSDDRGKSLLFDVVLPISAYEAPERYGLAPPLLLEVYIDGGMAPDYPNEPPVLAVIGGGLPEDRLRELTRRLRLQAYEFAKDDPGEPQIFNLVTFVGEEVVRIIAEEKEELESARNAERRKMQEKIQQETAKRNQSTRGPPRANYKTEAERRAYARDVVAASAGSATANTRSSDEPNSSSTKSSKKIYQTGVSDESLLKDLFG